MAPAFDFGGNRRQQLGEAAIDDWRQRGTLSAFHHGDGQPRDIGFGLYEDAARYDDESAAFLDIDGAASSGGAPAPPAGSAASRHRAG